MAELDCLVRVSRVGDRKGERFQSPKAQREACLADAKAHGHRVVKVFEELDVSGGSRDRPVLETIIRRIESGQTRGVIVARFDRFSRSLTGALAAIERIERAGGEVVSVAEKLDTTTPVGRAMLRILLVLAELYREQQTEAFAESRRRAVARGVHIAGRVPFGYRREGRGRPLEIDPAVAPIVVEVYQRRAAGEAFASIYRDLNERQVTTGDGGRWTSAGLGQLVANRVYLGEARSGDMVNRRAHDPLVDEESWQRAQPGKSSTPHRERRTLLAGLIRCAGCSRALTGGGGLSYFCHGQHAAGRCPRPASIRQRFADAHVETLFFGWLEGASLIGAVAEADERLVTARERADQSELELSAWRDDVEISAMDRAVYLAGLRSRIDARDRAVRLLEEAREDAGHAALPDATVLRDAWPEMSVAERREVLAGGIDVVFLRGGRRPVGERLHVCWRGDGPRDLPRPARVTPIVGFRFPDDVDGDDAAGVSALEDAPERVRDV